jgi:hypothetical protein
MKARISRAKTIPCRTIVCSRWACLAFLFAAATLLSPPKASATTPSITVSASSPLVASPLTILGGGSVTVSGTGFDANKPLMLWLDTSGNGHLELGEPAYPRPILTDGTGAFTMPDTDWPMTDVPAGVFFIQAGACSAAPTVGLCVGTAGVAQAQLTIKLGLSHSSFGGGTTIGVTGYGFSSSTTVHVWYDNDPNGVFVGGSASTSPSTDSTGAFTTSLVVSASPGDHYFHAGSSATPENSIKFHVDNCWFQECMIDDADTICMIGLSPSDTFLGTNLTDCKKVDTSYTEPRCPTLTPLSACTLLNSPPGGYDFSNTGPTFMGAGLLAALTAELGPPPTGCVAMTAAIASAEGGYNNSVPDKVSLEAIACSSSPFGVLEPYIGGVELSGHDVPDKDVVRGAKVAIYAAAAAAGAAAEAAALATGVDPVTATAAGVAAAATALGASQEIVAEATVAGALACGYVNYYCNGSDITKTILQHPDLQRQAIPIPFLQPPIHDAPTPNPCAAAGVNGTCWGGIIGWAKVACKTLDAQLDSNRVGVCERPDKDDPTKYSQLPVPGSAGSPDNSGVDEQCTTGTVIGLSIGYDGDVSFDVSGPDVLRLVNYHNYLPGPGGTEPPNGIDIEIPVADRPLFLSTLTSLRPGMTVHVCGRWVADMHMLWNELHPVTSLSIVPPDQPPTADAGSPQTLEATSPAGASVNLSGTGADPDNDPLTFSWSEGSTTLGAGAQVTVTLPIGVHTITLTDDDGRGGTGTSTVSITVQDTTPPSFTPPSNQTLEATSPAGAVGTFSATAIDIVDGTDPVICSPASGSTFSFGTTTVNCTSTDAHNNSSSGSFTITVRDTIAPTIACGSPDGLWHQPDVSIACTSSDSGSGLKNPSDANFLLSTSVAAGTETAAAQTGMHQVCDISGNCATGGPVGPIKVDKKGPSVTFIAPADGSVYMLNQSVTVNFSCMDGGSGLNTCNGTVAKGGTLDSFTSSVGPKSFTINASDNVGNTTSKTVNYSVTYNICLLYDPTKAKKSGSTYPIQIQICDVGGHNVSAPGIIVHAVSVTMASTNAPGVLDDAGNSNPDFDFRYDGGSYMFNLKTTGNSTGTYNLNFTAGSDPLIHSVPFQIK